MRVFCGKILRLSFSVVDVEKIFFQGNVIFVVHSVNNQFSMFDCDGNCLSKFQLVQLPYVHVSRWFSRSQYPATSGTSVVIPIHRCERHHITTFQTYDLSSGMKLFSFDVNDVVLNSCVDSDLNIYVVTPSKFQKFDNRGMQLSECVGPNPSIFQSEMTRIFIIEKNLYIVFYKRGCFYFCDELGNIQWKIQPPRNDEHVYVTPDRHIMTSSFSTNKIKFQCFY